MNTRRAPGTRYRARTLVVGSGVVVALVAALLLLGRWGALVGIAVIGSLLVVVELAAPLQRVRRPHEGWHNDLLHLVVNRAFVAAAAATVASVVGLALRPAVPSTVYDAITSQPVWLRFVEALLIAEFMGYWTHRLMHSANTLWRFHKVHHSVEDMNWLAGQRVHPVDLAFTRIAYGIPLVALGFSVAAFVVVAALLEFQSVFVHVNSKLTFGRLGTVLVTPEFHHWHHVNEPGRKPANFAGKFSLLDRMFGTYHVPATTWPSAYGIEDEVPSTYAAQLFWPVDDLADRCKRAAVGVRSSRQGNRVRKADHGGDSQ